MGVDYGKRRVGVALSDPTRFLATPLTTILRRRGKRPPFKTLVALAQEHGVGHIVVGLPLTLAGTDAEWTTEVREFAEGLSDRSGCPVDMVDERFSTVTAERRIRSIGLPKSKREEKGRIDAAAAALILQDWLDAHQIST